MIVVAGGAEIKDPIMQALEGPFHGYADQKRFVCWKPEDRGGPKPTKPPINAVTGSYADNTDSATWTNAWKAYAATAKNHYSGIGIVVNGDGLIGGDLDNCIDENGSIAPWAQEILDTAKTYAEISPSQKGIRFFATSKEGLPAGRRKNGQIELYETERYLTITGNHIAGTPLTIEERSNELKTIHRKFLQPTSKPANGRDGWAFEHIPSDKPRHDEILRRIGILKKSGASKEFALEIGLALAEKHNTPDKSRILTHQEVQKEVEYIYRNENLSTFTLPTSLVISADELRATKLPEREWYITGVQPAHSAVMTFGPAGIGKTRLQISKEISISQGTQFLSYEVPKPHRCLHVDGELTLDTLQAIVKDFAGEESLANLDFIPSEKLYNTLGCSLNLNLPEHQTAFLRLLDDLDKENRLPDLICFDNISTLFIGVEENSNTEQEAAILFFVRLRHQGFSVDIIHHAGNSGNQRGGTRRVDVLDTVIKLSEPQSKSLTGAKFKLSYAKTRYKPPKPFSFECELTQTPSGLLAWSIDTVDKDQSVWIQILKWSSDNTPEYQKDIADAFEISPQMASRHITKCRDKGFLDGLKITESGKKFIQKKYGFSNE